MPSFGESFWKWERTEIGRFFLQKQKKRMRGVLILIGILFASCSCNEDNHRVNSSLPPMISSTSQENNSMHGRIAYWYHNHSDILDWSISQPARNLWLLLSSVLQASHASVINIKGLISHEISVIFVEGRYFGSFGRNPTTEFRNHVYLWQESGECPSLRYVELKKKNWHLGLLRPRKQRDYNMLFSIITGTR